MFEDGAEIRTRISVHQINAGYALRGEPLDNEGRAALDAMLDIFEDPAVSADFDFAPGEIQFVDNRTLGHSRTEYEDWPEPAKKRHSYASGCGIMETGVSGIKKIKDRGRLARIYR